MLSYRIEEESLVYVLNSCSRGMSFNNLIGAKDRYFAELLTAEAGYHVGLTIHGQID